MKVCSFLPAATTMIHDMELDDFLFGVTFECPSDKPKVVRSILEGRDYTSGEIDAIVSRAKAQGKSLYYIDEELLQQIAPDIIFTQDVCDVCQIDTSYVQRAVLKLKKQPLLIPLTPHNLSDVFADAVTIAKAVNKEENAYRHLASQKRILDNIIDTLRKHKAPLKRVMLIEWIDPVYSCGHWIPDMIAQAGATDMLGNPGGHSSVVSWEKIIRYNPEVIVIAPCGFKPSKTLQEMHKLAEQAGWNGLMAVKNNSVFIADGDLFTCPSTRLTQGIELLAALFHPGIFSLSGELSARVMQFDESLYSNNYFPAIHT